jgi:hypothetical protein
MTRSRAARAVVVFLLIVGVALRLRQYLANRSLWLDESYLSLNIIHRDFASLLRPLDHAQVAPPGFLLLQRAVVELGGFSEYALRALPVAAAIVAVFVAWRLAESTLPALGAVLALAMFAISAPLVYFAVEAKQYSTDVAVAITLWWAMTALTPRLDVDRPVAWALLVILGAVAVWVSHPAIFVVGGFALESSFRALSTRSWRSLAVRIAAGTMWVVSFGALYLASLRFVNPSMYRGWRGAAAPVVPSSFGAMSKYVDAVWTLSSLPLGRQVAPLVTLAAVLGVAALARWAPRQLAWFAGALVLGWTASSFGHYPVAERLWVFFTPVMVILSAAGVTEVWQRTRGVFPMLGPVLACLLLAYPSLAAARGVVEPRQHEEIRPLLVHVRQHYREGDVLYLYQPAQYAAQYYAARGITFPGVVIVGTPTDEADVAGLRGHPRVWLLFAHVIVSDGMNEERRFLRLVDGLGRRLESRSETGASLYLYDLSH